MAARALPGGMTAGAGMAGFAIGIIRVVKFDFLPVVCVMAVGALTGPVSGGHGVTAATVVVTGVVKAD